MLRSFNKIISLVCTFLISFPCFALEFRINYENQAYPPFYYGLDAGPDSAYPGLSLDIIKKITSKLNLTVVYSRAPWKRCLHSVEEGVADATFNAGYTKDREAWAVYPMKNGVLDNSKKLGDLNYLVFYDSKQVPPWDGNAFLNQQKPVGINLGFSISSVLKDKKITYKEFSTTKQLFQALRLGKIQAVIALDTMGYEFMHGGLQVAKDPFHVESNFLLISKKFEQKNPGMSDKIFTEIKNIRDSSWFKKREKEYLSLSIN